MPTDPVYNPSLPHSGHSYMSGSSSLGSGSSSIGGGSSPGGHNGVSMGSVPSCRSSSASWSLAAGLCAGALAGAALALLYTPRRGSDIRRSLRSYASQGGEKLQGMVSTGRCLAEDAIHQATALIEEGRRALNTSRAGDAGGSSSVRSFSNSSQPLTASVAEISGIDRRFEEPLGG